MTARVVAALEFDTQRSRAHACIRTPRGDLELSRELRSARYRGGGHTQRETRSRRVRRAACQPLRRRQRRRRRRRRLSFFDRRAVGESSDRILCYRAARRSAYSARRRVCRWPKRTKAQNTRAAPSSHQPPPPLKRRRPINICCTLKNVIFDLNKHTKKKIKHSFF